MNHFITFGLILLASWLSFINLKDIVKYGIFSIYKNNQLYTSDKYYIRLLFCILNLFLAITSLLFLLILLSGLFNS